MKVSKGLVCASIFGAVLLGVTAVIPSVRAPAWAQASAPLQPVKVSVRRITESQYRHTIADLFGADLAINARFEPEKREDGLLALGSANLSLTSSGFEQYFAMAGTISEQVFDPVRRDALVGCKPADAKKADAACAGKFITRVGERLFRRPLTPAEAKDRIDTASIGAARTSSFDGGLKLALTSLLMAPEYLFRVEVAEPDPKKAGAYRLDAYSKAERLSFLLWDTGPDDALLASARTGAIHTEAGLNQQLIRLTSSPRFKDGARAFFIDMLQLDGFDTLIKDPAAYPKFNQSVADSAREQTLRTTLDLLVDQRRDYRDLFTSNETFLNRHLAAVYKVPFASGEEWARYTFPEASERAGILTQVSFLSLFAHPGSSSPTRRGIKVHEIFMCEPTPDPPADVDFSKVQALATGTVRTRLLDHMQNTGCTACHRRSDPPGLALEHFDGLGQLRKKENGALIDVTANLDGKTFVGAQGLAAYLRDDPRIPACLVRNVYSYGTGRTTDERDEDYLAGQSAAFASKGYRLPDLMIQIASSPEFFKAVIPSGMRLAAMPISATRNSTFPISTTAKP